MDVYVLVCILNFSGLSTKTRFQVSRSLFKQLVYMTWASNKASKCNITCLFFYFQPASHIDSRNAFMISTPQQAHFDGRWPEVTAQCITFVWCTFFYCDVNNNFMISLHLFPNVPFIK